jgi:hypothetical protein
MSDEIVCDALFAQWVNTKDSTTYRWAVMQPDKSVWFMKLRPTAVDSKGWRRGGGKVRIGTWKQPADWSKCLARIEPREGGKEQDDDC